VTYVGIKTSACGIAMIAYHLEVTTFEAAARLTKSIVERPDNVSAGSVGEATFLGEDGRQFTVPSVLTTSADRARAALEYWLPRQEHWPEFEWE
jgi:hypothetical protein